MFTTDDIFDFLGELRRSGFDFSTEQYIAVHDLVLALAAQGALAQDIRKLKTLLAPILCTSPQEQDILYERFNRWLSLRPYFMEDSSVERSAEGELDLAGKLKMAAKKLASLRSRPSETVPKQAARLKELAKGLGYLQWLCVAMGTIVLLGIVLVFYFKILSQERIFTLSGNVVTHDIKAVSDAVVIFMDQQKTTASDGRFHFRYASKKGSSRLTVNHPQFNPTSLLIEHKSGSPDTTIVLDSLKLADAFRRLQPVPRREEDVQLEKLRLMVNEINDYADRFEVKQLQLQPSSFGMSLLRSFILSFIIYIPFLLVWMIWRWFRGRLQLEKRRTLSVPEMQRIVVRGSSDELFRGPLFRRTAQQLRLHRDIASRELNAAATVNATARRAGVFTPVYRDRQVLPEYLALVDRATFHDQQARRADELLNRLKESGVFIDRYYFDGDPRTCYGETPVAPAQSLTDLAMRYPDHRLLIFSDGAGLMHPITGRPQRWLEKFSDWNERALLTPEFPEQWGYRESALAGQDFMVMPATQAGLAVLIESMQRNLTFSVSPADGAAAYPELLAQRPMLYLEQNEPEPAKVEQLCRQLMNYLGDEGFYWLCACAVYPMLGWDLTIYLGYRLLDDAGQKLITEERLLRLARLPWLRYGMMPNWWRLRLIQEMGRQGETAVRKALQDLLESAIEEPGQGFILDVARTPGLKRRHWRRILKFLKTTPEESGMHDYVFLTYMSGRRPRRLAVGVPNVLRRFFSNRTKTWFDWLPVAVAGVLIMFSLGLAWLSKSSPYVPPIIPHFREAMAAVNERLRLEGHTDDVRCVAFRPDGRTLASGSEDGSIRLWDVAGGAERRRLEGHTGWIRCIAFSPDGRTLASGSDDGSIRLWDVASGAERARLGGPSGVVYCVAFSPDGRTLASGSADRIVRLWDIASGTERRWLEGHTDDVNSVAFSPDGGTLASGSLDGSIRLWDIASGVVRSILKGESGAIESVAFSPDGATLASGSWDESIRLWDVVSGIELRRLEDQSGGIFSVAFSRDGVTLASGSEDGTVRIWDVASGTERHQLEGHTGWTRSVAFSPDGRTLASGSSDGTIRLWDLVQGQSGDYTSTMPLAYSDQPLQVYADFLSRHPYRLVADSIRGDIQWSDSTQDKMDYPSVLTNGLMQTVGFDTSMFQFVSKDSLPDVAETDFGGKDLAPLFLRIKSKQKIGRIEEAAPFGKTIKADPRAQTDRRLRESSAPPFSRTVDADSIARIDTLKDVLVAPQFNRATDAGSDAQSDTVLNELPNSQFERPANRDSSTQIDTLKDVLVAPQTDKETPPDTRTRTDTLQNEPDVQQKMRTKN